MNEKDIKQALSQARGLVTALEKMLPEKSQLPAKVKFSVSSNEHYLAWRLHRGILERDPQFKMPNSQVWAGHIDRLMRLDKRSFSEILAVIKWCQSDDFWQNNILSTKKLREKFPQLLLKMNGERNGKSNKSRKFAKGEQDIKEIKRNIDSAFPE